MEPWRSEGAFEVSGIRTVSSDTCEMVCKRAFEFYESLPDGKTRAGKRAGGARETQINKPLVDHLGDPPGEKKFWLGSSSVIEDWKSAPETKTIARPIKVLQAIFELWGVDLSEDARFSRVSVKKSAEDLIELGEVTVERTSPGADRPYILRFNKVELKTKTKRWGKEELGRSHLVQFGLTDAVLKFEVSRGDDKTSFSELSYDGPGCAFLPLVVDLFPAKDFHGLGQSGQNGIATGLSVQWTPGSRWRFKTLDRALHDGHLTNATLCEFVAEPGDIVQVNLTVGPEDFDADVDLSFAEKEELFARHSDPEDYKNDVRARLASQILKHRLAGSEDRSTLAGGKVPVE